MPENEPLPDGSSETVGHSGDIRPTTLAQRYREIYRENMRLRLASARMFSHPKWAALGIRIGGEQLQREQSVLVLFFELLKTGEEDLTEILRYFPRTDDFQRKEKELTILPFFRQRIADATKELARLVDVSGESVILQKHIESDVFQELKKCLDDFHHLLHCDDIAAFQFISDLTPLLESFFIAVGNIRRCMGLQE